MTNAADFGSLPWRSRDREREIALPKPEPFGAPVLMCDAITPLAGETVLSLLWKRFDRPEDR
ncbi:hypothetical protein BOO69_01100 [Sulfitobacter alexandrii]|uniref:Uncharacterized protein n=1 Tax=Sulfitobacter alexandrii TaxID=1917485 RepID=A0A1J0WD99_9RHOB|nr:hypothetical protein [Sulfitobacter alexandrii]APE42160.1 hypothetical protein BOO69_01100 [Sulfitobacter alexandrii]